MSDELKLLKKLRNKNLKSLEYAIDLYTPYISVVLYNYVGNKLSSCDIEEIISDCFVTLWKNADYIDLNKGTIRSYISKTAKNLALKKLSKYREYVPLDDVDTAYEKEEKYDYIWNYVMELGEPDSEIFVRFYKYDERLKDISKAMDIPLSTVKTKLSRGKTKLKNKLKDSEEML